MNIFGKKIENVRNYSKIYLCHNWEGPFGAKSLISKSNFKRMPIFNENLVEVEMNLTSINFEKPVYEVAVILELAKTVMYKFHYNIIRPHF